MNATSLPGFGKAALLLVALTLLLALPQAALLPLLDRDEPRFAEASREMLQSGNFVVPTFNQAPRYAKPPLIYWCQAASFLVFGENAFAARLPSLLAVTGTALLLLAWGRALGSHEGGLIAALAYALCLQVMQQGRVATADALLIFFMTLTGFAGWRMLDLVRTGRGSWNLWGLILAFGFGGGFLAKGPEALLPIVPILVSARWMGWRGLASFVLILALGLLLVAAWAVPAFVQTHGDYWREGLGHDVGDRMVTGFQGHGAATFGKYLLWLPFYVLTFWLSTLPWSPLLAVNLGRLRAAAPPDWTDRYLGGNAALVFAVFSLMVTKLPHYTLPAFPFLTLLFGRRWMLAKLAPARPLQTLLIFGLVLAGVTLVGVPQAIRAGWTCSPVAMLINQGIQDRSLNDRINLPAAPLAMADFEEPSAVWEFRRLVQPWMTPRGASESAVEYIGDDQIFSYLHKPGLRAVIMTRKSWEGVKSGISPQFLPGKLVGPSTWHVYEATGFNSARLKRVDLMLVVKPAGTD